jgi:hypothetical protein
VALDKEDSRVHEQIIRFKLAVDTASEDLHPKSAEIIKSEFTLIPASTPLAKFNEDYLSRHKDSVRKTISALKVRKLLSSNSTSSCERDIAAVIELPTITSEEARETLELLRTWKSSESESFRSKAAAKWPKATVFEASG